MREYKTIVVDPPWDYKEQGKSKNPKHIERYGENQMFVKGVTADYDGVMSIEEIKDLDIVKQLSAKDCFCFLWATNKFLFECPSILSSWGFDIGEGGRVMCWHKIRGLSRANAGAKTPNNWLSNAEYIVVGKRGNIRWTTTRGLKACFEAINEGHSIKPASFYRMIRDCTHEPRIDIFARRRHDGFDAWGNQVEVREDDLVSRWPKVKISKLDTGELHEDLLS